LGESEAEKRLNNKRADKPPRKSNNCERDNRPPDTGKKTGRDTADVAVAGEETGTP